MSALDLRKASTFCVLAVTAGYLQSRSTANCRGGTIQALAFRSAKPDLTTMNAGGLMDMFKGVSGSSKGSFTAEEFLRMVKAIEAAGAEGSASGSTTIDIIPAWDDLDRILRAQETPEERVLDDLALAGAKKNYHSSNIKY